MPLPALPSLPPKLQILVFGEVLVDLIRSNEDAPGIPPKELIGGAPANFAYRLISRQGAEDNFDLNLVSAIGGAAVALTDGGMSPVEERHLEIIRDLPRNHIKELSQHLSP